MFVGPTTTPADRAVFYTFERELVGNASDPLNSMRFSTALEADAVLFSMRAPSKADCERACAARPGCLGLYYFGSRCKGLSDTGKAVKTRLPSESWRRFKPRFAKVFSNGQRFRETSSYGFTEAVTDIDGLRTRCLNICDVDARCVAMHLAIGIRSPANVEFHRCSFMETVDPAQAAVDPVALSESWLKQQL